MLDVGQIGDVGCGVSEVTLLQGDCLQLMRELPPRDFIGMELNANYFAIATKRIEAAQQQLSLAGVEH